MVLYPEMHVAERAAEISFHFLTHTSHRGSALPLSLSWLNQYAEGKGKGQIYDNEQIARCNNVLIPGFYNIFFYLQCPHQLLPLLRKSHYIK